MRSSGLVIWRASGAGCQWASTTSSRTPRFSKIADLTHISNAKLTRSFSGVAHTQHISKTSNCAQVQVKQLFPAFVSPTPTKGRRSVLCSSAVRRHTTSTMASSTPATIQQWTAPKVRDTFIKYFEERGHLHGEAWIVFGHLCASITDLVIQSNPRRSSPSRILHSCSRMRA
jgi:hypothetical protein